MDAHYNPYVTCPYNKAHEVPKLRIQHHLIKCRKRYPSSTMKTCPFNATHIMPEQELQWHFRFCTDRNLIEGQKYNLSCAHGELGNATFHPDVPKEDWDDFDNPQAEPQLPLCSSRSDNHPATFKPIEDREFSNDALKPLKDSRSVAPSVGFGRGHLYHLLAKMNGGVE